MYIITDPCIETKDTACVDACPVDCIHPTKNDPEFVKATMLYINPDECIDCGACLPACPVAAIYDSEASVPPSQQDLIEANKMWYQDQEAAEKLVAAHIAAHLELMGIPADQRQAAHN
jgi:ferredoxin